MENTIHVKLECSIQDPRAISSLMELMLEKLKVIQSISGSVQRMELKLFDESGSEKIALFRLISDQINMVEYARSKRWDDAVLNAIEKIRERCIQVNPWASIA
ncbi:hypothetical protein [Flavihumibacter petaseus]|uniref:Uncharacterized protein n=1 Tax=Flavihumibacter petaseus NBRC 106054 TaxID=1220578 RepID=A0A0E9MXW5_9BACT|nr:hypothetical protein [Flavihumibacter petaseus]GAO42419.1 hypothetical protein FPE01S_01_14340 [Flavihumibacter petaseus NBRC 106054]